MELLIRLAGVFCAVATIFHIASILIVAWRSRSSRASATTAFSPMAVSPIRPVCGIENFSTETLGSAFTLEYPDYEIIFCVAHAGDPIVPLVRRLIEQHPQVRARLLVGNDAISANPKLNNMLKGWRAAEHDWIVMADSNLLIPSDYLQRCLAAWRQDTGLVCSPPVGCAPSGFWAELECAFLNTHQARWQYFAASLGFGFAQGKSMLWRRDTLERAGGIERLGDELAEDAAATKLVRGAGFRVRLVDRPFDQPLGYRSARDVWERQLRWARLRRDTFRLWFIPEVLTGLLPPFIGAAIYASAADWPLGPTLLALGVSWYAAEAWLARMAGWHLDRRSPLIWMLRDLMLPLLWVWSWTGNDFVWRGNEMRVADRGRAA